MRVQTWENKGVSDKGVSVGFQEKAVIEEYRKAKVVDHTTLAQGIRLANPDLREEFDKVDKSI